VANELITAEPESGAEPPTRRAAFAVAAGGCAFALAGCSSYGEDAAAVVSAAPSADATEAGEDAAEGGEEDEGGGGSAQSIASVSKIPVGGGLILKKQGVVLTQPTKGKIKAFSATCTHAGCAVTKVADGTINCPCHGSKFAVADGSVTGGPAPRPLPEQPVTVQGTSIVLA
jgi:Rieske Fe-S protein